jgi:hypothetical protein
MFITINVRVTNQDNLFDMAPRMLVLLISMKYQSIEALELWEMPRSIVDRERLAAAQVLL